MSSENNLNGELDLLAFRYVSDELTDAELQQFEAMLAEDQAAREAVARAVRIGRAVVLAETAAVKAADARGQAAPFALGSQRLWAVVAASIAIAFLAGVGISHWFDSPSVDTPSSIASRDNDPVTDDPVTDEGAAPELVVSQELNGTAMRVVALWSASAEEFEQYAEDISDTIGTDGEETEMAFASSDSWPSNGDASVDAEEFSVPSWMLAAVSPDDDSDLTPEEN